MIMWKLLVALPFLPTFSNGSSLLIPLSAWGKCATELSEIVRLSPGDRICSRDGTHTFGLSETGDLTIWKGSSQLWTAGISWANSYAQLQVDGNFVVRAGENVLWSSQTHGGVGFDTRVFMSNTGVVTILNKAAGKELIIDPSVKVTPVTATLPEATPRSCLSQVSGRIDFTPGKVICSPNGRFHFGINFKGNLGLFDGDQQIWLAGTCCAEDYVSAALQTDGNLVVRTSRGDSLWSSKTSNESDAGSSITLSDGGMVAVTNPDGYRVWAIAPNPPKSNCLPQVDGRILLKDGEFICSENAQFRFGLFDGDLSLWEYNRLRWSAGTCCAGDGIQMKLRFSGNLVVVNSAKQQLFSAETGKNEGASLRLGNNGQPQVISRSGNMLWSLEERLLDMSDPNPIQTNAPSPGPLSSPPTDKPIRLAPHKQLRCVDVTVGWMKLFSGDVVCSPNGEHKFGMSIDGELVLLEGNRKVWASGSSGYHTTMQLDGNLVLRGFDNKLRWSTATSNSEVEDVSLVVGDDGVAAIHCSRRGYVWSTAVAMNGRVTPDTLFQKVMAGYQGWFHVEGDGGWDRWQHWSMSRTVPDEKTVTIDMWPNVSELDDDELYPTEFSFADGSTALVYSAYNTKTVERHCKWMQDYNIDGVFLQRFIGTATKLPHVVDKVLGNIRSGSEKYGRVFALMYDISNGNDDTLVEDVINDWTRLVDEQFVTESNQYLHHRGRPLLAIWGLGVLDRAANYWHAVAILDWFEYEAEDRYKVSLMGGVPAGWRDLSRDSKRHPEWWNVYRRFDVLSPWTVGRMKDERSADYFLENYIIPDMKECEASGIDYLPVVFPGFSAHHLADKPLNEIPRQGGDFMWRQIYNTLGAGNTMLYIAMFDEMDEGTAIYKVAPTLKEAPVEASFLPLDADGVDLPTDWYLQLTGEAARYVHEDLECPIAIPILP